MVLTLISFLFSPLKSDRIFASFTHRASDNDLSLHDDGDALVADMLDSLGF